MNFDFKCFNVWKSENYLPTFVDAIPPIRGVEPQNSLAPQLHRKAVPIRRSTAQCPEGRSFGLRHNSNPSSPNRRFGLHPESMNNSKATPSNCIRRVRSGGKPSASSPTPESDEWVWRGFRRRGDEEPPSECLCFPWESETWLVCFTVYFCYSILNKKIPH